MATSAGIAVHHGNLPATSMRCACIDIGSNTTRLLVADVADGRLAPVVEQRAFTRIGRKLDLAGAIPDVVIAEVAAVVAAHCDRGRRGRRGARARRRHRRDPPGREPRRAGRRAAVPRAARRSPCSPATTRRGSPSAARRSTLAAPPPGTIAVVDVGGVSTEIAVGTLAGGVTWAHSFAIGSSALAGRCHGDPPSLEDLATMRAAAAGGVRGRADPGGRRRGRRGRQRRLAADARRPGRSTRAALERALGVLTGAPAAEVARRNGLAPERTQLLPAGILVLDAAAQRLGRPLRIGRGGLREGVILELANPL